MAAMTAVSGMVLQERLDGVRSRIAAVGGDPARVRVVAVTKGFGPAAVRAALAVGVRDLGENYAQELIAKAATLDDLDVRWHFLGPVQRSKVARLARVVARWHGLDRPSAIDVVAARSGAPALLQVNLTCDRRRPGCAPAEAEALVEQCHSQGLVLDGLMTVGPVDDPAGSRRCFAELARIGGSLGLRELSMGMSDDFEAAVAEGATMVRLGRSLFGARPGAGSVRR